MVFGVDPVDIILGLLLALIIAFAAFGAIMLRMLKILEAIHHEEVVSNSGAFPKLYGDTAQPAVSAR